MKKEVNVEKQVAKFEIELSGEELVKYLDEAITEAIKDKEEDGFRKGKMPKNIYLKKYGVESVYPTAIDLVLNDTYPQLIMEKELNVVSNPEINWETLKIDEKEGFSVTGTVDLFPEVCVTDYDKVKDSVTKEEASVSDEEVKSHIDSLLNDKAVVEVSEEPAKSGDTVVIDFDGYVGDEQFEGGKAENHELVLGSNSFIPGFEDQLIGKKEGDDVDVVVTFPEEYHAENLAGKEATFKTKIHEVKTTTVPELTDELAAEIDTYEANTAAELTVAAKDALLVQKTEQALNKYNFDVISKLIENSEVVVPQSMIDREVEQQIETMKNQLESQGIQFDMYLQMMGGDINTVKSQMEPEAKRRIEEFLVIDAVVKAEDIKIDDSEAEEKVAELSEQNNMTKEEVMEALGGDLERLKENIAYDKAYKLVLGE